MREAVKKLFILQFLNYSKKGKTVLTLGRFSIFLKDRFIAKILQI